MNVKSLAAILVSLICFEVCAQRSTTAVIALGQNEIITVRTNETLVVQSLIPNPGGQGVPLVMGGRTNALLLTTSGGTPPLFVPNNETRTINVPEGKTILFVGSMPGTGTVTVADSDSSVPLQALWIPPHTQFVGPLTITFSIVNGGGGHCLR